MTLSSSDNKLTPRLLFGAGFAGIDVALFASRTFAEGLVVRPECRCSTTVRVSSSGSWSQSISEASFNVPSALSAQFLEITF